MGLEMGLLLSPFETYTKLVFLACVVEMGSGAPGTLCGPRKRRAGGGGHVMVKCAYFPNSELWSRRNARIFR